MKKIIAMLLVLVIVLSLTACSGEKQKKPVTISMVAIQHGNKTADWWEGFEQKFEESNQGIDLVVDVIPRKDIYTIVSNRIANGFTPDLLNIDTFVDYQADGLLLPASEWISEKTYAKFFPSFLDESVVDDVVWAVPYLTYACALYYNADILAAAGVEVPTTWEELRSVCESIKAHDASIYPWGVDMTTDEGQACFAYYAWSNGGGFVDEEGNWTLNSPENVEAIEFIVGMVKDGLTNPDPTSETRYDLQEMFAAGKVAIMIGSNQISKYCEAKGGINYGIASLPTNGNKASVSVGVMDRIMCFDNDYSEAELAAVTAVVDTLYDDEPYAEWVLMEGFLPVTSTGSELCAQADPGMAAWIDFIGSAKFYPAAKAEWTDVKQGVIDVQNQVLLGGDAQALLDALQAEISG